VIDRVSWPAAGRRPPCIVAASDHPEGLLFAIHGLQMELAEETTGDGFRVLAVFAELQTSAEKNLKTSDNVHTRYILVMPQIFMFKTRMQNNSIVNVDSRN
jgi:hypothetical protein